MPSPTQRDVHANNQPLANVSIGYKNEAYIFDQVFPMLTVQKQTDFYYVYDRASWFRNVAATRGPGQPAPDADYDVTTASYSCINDSLAHTIPDEVIRNADAPIRPLAEGAEFVTDGLLRAAEIRVANIITASSGTWANAASPATQWDSDGSDPWGDIDTGMNTIVSNIGRMPNTAVMSWGVWRHLRQHPDFLDRVKYTRPSGRVEPEDLRSWFGFDKVLIGTSLKDLAQKGATASPTYIWGDDFWIGYVAPTPSLRTPSAGYVFVWGQREFQTIDDRLRHRVVVEGQWYTDEVVAASDAGYCIFKATAS